MAGDANSPSKASNGPSGEKKLAVQTCYQLGLDDAAHPAGTGRIVFQTTLYPSGLKSSFTIGTNTLEHPETEDCVARVLKTFSVPSA